MKKLLLIACLFPSFAYAQAYDKIVKACSDSGYLESTDGTNTCLSFFQYVDLQNADQTPIINACADKDFARYNYYVCDAYFKNVGKAKGKSALEELHKQLKHCSITDKQCFTDVVIKMRNLD